MRRVQGPGPGEPTAPIDHDAAALQRLAGQRYRDLEFAGRGSLGAVYRAFDVEFGSTVALKTILDVGPDFIYRLKREFRVLRGVIHRNLAQLYDLVVGDDACFFTMEFVDGPDFVEFVRGSRDDSQLATVVERLLGTAPQLVEGVRTLHAAGHLHRDIKPSNLKVDAGGRVVLLDFDLVAPLERMLPMDFASAQLAGTLAYMAPEQMLGRPVGPPADWYAVGGVLYESLSGSLPVDRDELIRSAASGKRRIVPLRQRVPEAPAWLAELIEALLAGSASERIDGDELLACLAARRAPARRGERGDAGRPFALIGRERELEDLERIYREGSAAVVGVHGSSGVGKTELLRGFLSRIAPPGAAGPLVLTSRCNAQESVPYQALDPIIDALSRHFVEHDVEPPLLEARRAAALLRLFPVLARVPEIAAGAGAAGVPDVFEARRLGTGALRELLAALAQPNGLVLWIDDAQWSDADSGTLLGEVLRPPDSPRLLLLLSYRSEDRSGIALLAALEGLRAQFPELALREIEVAPLTREHALLLARESCASAPLTEELIDAIVSEAQGSPFLIQQMVRHLESRTAGTGAATSRLDLSNVVSERVRELAPGERQLLELVSLCGQPTERGLILRAGGVGSRGSPLLARLEGRSLVRMHAAHGEHAVQAYHDRIREAISGELPAETRVERHRQLAEAFESSGRVEPDVLAHHFHGASQLGRASDYALSAAEKAADALAFLRAAELFRSAREWDPRSPERERGLCTREAECTANASRLVDAGRLYLAASTRAPRAEALELRRRASEHLLAGGSVEEGTSVLAALLAELDLRYPRSARRAALGSLRQLASVFLRDLSTRDGGRTLDPVEQIRIDTCFGIGKTLVDMDAMRGTYFSFLGLARALASGDRYRTARSLTLVGGLLWVLGGPLAKRGRRMLEVARALAEELEAPELLGTLAVAEGQVLMLHGQWRRARERAGEGVRLLSERCQGFAYECDVGRGNVLRALEEIGDDVSEISVLARQYYEAATSAASAATETGAVQHLAFVAMARGDLDAARRFARRGVALWTRAGFHVQHLYTARAEAQCDLYEGRARASFDRLRELWGPLRRSNLMRVPLARVDAHFLRGQLALAVARVDAGAREGLLRGCEGDARKLAHEGRHDATAHACLLRAGAHELRGRPELALPLLDEAIAACDAGGMVLRGACALLRKGEILGGETGRRCADEARARIVKSGIAEPGRWAAMYAFGIDRAQPGYA